MTMLVMVADDVVTVRDGVYGSGFVAVVFGDGAWWLVVLKLTFLKILITFRFF